MNITTNGLIIRASDYRDSDKILTVMTQEYGRLTVKAQGAKRKSSRFGASCQLFTYSNMTIYENKGYYTLTDAEAIEQFYDLSKDLDALSLASYFCELLATEGEENVPTPGLLRLALNGFFALSKKLYPPILVKAAFELRFMAMVGYQPNAERLAGLSGNANLAAQYILTADLKKLFAFKIDEADMKRLADFAENYVCGGLERAFKTLDFYKSVQI